MKTTKQTTAARASTIMGDDGSRHTADSGLTLDAVARRLGATFVRGTDNGRADKYLFPDGSVITCCGSAWDLGYLDCDCWQGNGHSEADPAICKAAVS